MKTSKQGQFQIVDVVDMMRPLTKYTKQLVSAANIPSRIRESMRLAQEEKPGAVHLELPEDIASEETDEPLIEASLVRRPTSEAKSIAAAVARIQNAKSPLLVVGAGGCVVAGSVVVVVVAAVLLHAASTLAIIRAATTFQTFCIVISF